MTNQLPQETGKTSETGAAAASPVVPATEGSPKIAKIMVDRNLCIGAASCVAVLPSVFELDPENKAVLRRKQPPPVSDLTAKHDLADQSVDDEMLLLAAKSCPTQAIFLYDEAGNQMYP